MICFLVSLSSPASDGRSVGIVHSQMKVSEFSLVSLANSLDDTTSEGRKECGTAGSWHILRCRPRISLGRLKRTKKTSVRVADNLICDVITYYI
jgi:hypothetical protein